MTIYYVNIKSPFVSVDPAVVGKSFSLYVVSWQTQTPGFIPVSILRKSISGHHRSVRVADGPMTARCRFT